MADSARHLQGKERSCSEKPWAELIHCDPEILGGMPVFVGTRIPVESITASLDQGTSKERILEVYPSLTHAHLEAATAYAAEHPERSPVHQLGECNPDWILISSGVIRPATK